MGWTLAEAAKKLGVSVTLIRRYEREFELQFTRDERGHLVLAEQDLANLKIIRAYRQKNLPFDEIKAILSRSVVQPVESGPDVREVIGALVARQDELEKVVQAQGSAISQLMEANRQLLQSNESLILQLEAPKEPGLATDLDERLRELETRAREAAESLDAQTKDEMLRKLQRRLLDLEAAVASELTAKQEEDEGLLDELARAIHSQATEEPRKWWHFWR